MTREIVKEILLTEFPEESGFKYESHTLNGDNLKINVKIKKSVPTSSIEYDSFGNIDPWVQIPPTSLIGDMENIEISRSIDIPNFKSHPIVIKYMRENSINDILE